MKELTDEILNKLIDNELSSSEIDELHQLIKNNDEKLSKTKAHQMVNSVLKNLKIESAPDNTTELIMAKISKSILAKDRKDGFFKFIMATFAVSILLIIGYVVSATNAVQETPNPKVIAIKDSIMKYISSISLPISSEVLSVITSTITIIILVSGYFLFEQHKSFKQKLNSIL